MMFVSRMKLLASFLLVLLSSSVVSCHVQEQEPTRKLQQTAGNPFPLPLEGAFSQFFNEFFDEFGSSPAFLGDAGDSFSQLSNILAAAFSRGVQWGYDHPYTAAASPLGRKLAQATSQNPFPLPIEGAFTQFWSEFFDQYGDSPAFLGGDAGDSFGSLMRVLASAFSSGAQWGYDHPLVAAASPVG